MYLLRDYEPHDLPGLAAAWNRVFAGGPNFVAIGESDLRSRVLDQPGFEPHGIVVAADGPRLLGFAHCGPRLNLWFADRERPVEPEEGHIYALVAPDRETGITGDLLAAAEAKLAGAGARCVLLGPSWVCGGQPFYNGIAGGYETPGVSDTRAGLIALARDRGYAMAAEYGTPELDLEADQVLGRLERLTQELWERARRWGIEQIATHFSSTFFPPRVTVELTCRGRTIATTAYGPWPEYIRQYGRMVFGLTSVQVASGWRGRGLGKLVVAEATEAARREGAQAVHLHVWRGNKPAWNLYHHALGFRPGPVWVTMQKTL